MKLDDKFLWQEFSDEVKRLEHLQNTVLDKNDIELTPHNSPESNDFTSEDKNIMLRNYLLHILQFGTPEERIKVLAGIKSKFRLTDRKLELI